MSERDRETHRYLDLVYSYSEIIIRFYEEQRIYTQLRSKKMNYL
jgi:hypothetical protein